MIFYWLSFVWKVHGACDAEQQRGCQINHNHNNHNNHYNSSAHAA